MSKLKWHSGPPPHVGWWNASFAGNPDAWRWWNGLQWSYSAYPRQPAFIASLAAKGISTVSSIKWTDYYPENARVPRIKP